MHKIMIGAGIFIGTILLVENFRYSHNVYILFWNTGISNLIIISMLIGGMIGFGFNAILSQKKEEEEQFDY